MKSIHLKGMMGRFFLGFALLFGIGIMSSITAQAQWQNNPYGRDTYYERQQRQREREMRREQRRREREARRNNRDGYNDPYGYGYGNQRGYDGYGNQRGYDGYGNYGGSLHFRTTALNAGANEGIKEGRRDRERGERFDYTDESAYREATKDYSSRLGGDRAAYQRYFREAFITGYTEGYRGY